MVLSGYLIQNIPQAFIYHPFTIHLPSIYHPLGILPLILSLLLPGGKRDFNFIHWIGISLSYG